MASPRTLTGLDLLAKALPKWLRGRRVGLLMHPASVTARLESAVGRDLQYIRINGTLVGGMVGLILHVLDKL